MFTNTGLFSKILCPNVGKCHLTNCIFSHETKTKAAGDTPQPSSDLKRRKLDDGSKDASFVNGHTPPPPSKKEHEPFVGVLSSTKKPNHPTAQPRDREPPDGIASVRSEIKSAMRSISPPPLSSKAKLQTKSQSASVKSGTNKPKETLNPRKVPKDPAGHGTRLQYLKKLHELIQPLNDQVGESSRPEIKALHLSADELIKEVLDEEEKMVNEFTSIYSNKIKLRMLRYKKMTLEEWINDRRELIASRVEKPKEPVAKPPPQIETGLEPQEDVLLLSRLITDQTQLHAHGYTTSPPTESDISSAKKGLEAALGWEKCDRCTTRFQVFPDRREDGALTSGGTCTHHWGRPVYAPKLKTDDAPRRLYGCCNESLGSPGCTTFPTHVFKITSPNGLAAVMPFEQTPPNPSVGPGKAVCFDCEMGYTCYGLELIRLTATSWPSGDPLIDVLVRPLGHVLDLNSRFSGVFPEHFLEAVEYNSTTPAPATSPNLKSEGSGTKPVQKLPIVPNPAAARQLLMSHLDTTTPLIGHALENDLNSVRLVHPTIVDTVMLFPHKKGLPYRFGLKMLATQYLKRAIQQGGASGHDSLEDARAAGDLVRWKLSREWKNWQKEGWEIRDGALHPPQLQPSLGEKSGQDAAAETKAPGPGSGEQENTCGKRKWQEEEKGSGATERS